MPDLPEDGEMWTAGDGGVIVAFDESGRVTAEGRIRPRTYGAIVVLPPFHPAV